MICGSKSEMARNMPVQTPNFFLQVEMSLRRVDANVFPSKYIIEADGWRFPHAHNTDPSIKITS